MSGITVLTPEPVDSRMATAEGVKEAAETIAKLAKEVVAGLKKAVGEADSIIGAAKAEADKIEAKLADRAKMLDDVDDVLKRKTMIEKEVLALEARAAKAEALLAELKKVTG